VLAPLLISGREGQNDAIPPMASRYRPRCIIIIVMTKTLGRKKTATALLLVTAATEQN